jgi:putative ABC transport system permease protein
MQRGAPIPLFSRIPREWGEDIEKVPGIHVVSAEIWVRVNLINDKSIISPPRFFFGVDIDAHQKLKHGIYENAVIKGRYLNQSDKGLGHAIISKHIAAEFEVDVGDSLMVNGTSIEIVGIYHCGSLLLDIAIVVDQEFVRVASRFDPDTVCSFYIETTGDVPNEVISQKLQDIFRDRDIATWQPSSLLLDDSAGLADFKTGNPVVDVILTANRLLHRSSGTPLKNPEPKSRSSSQIDDSADGQKPVGSNSDQKSATSSDGPLEIRSAADWAEKFDEFSEDLDIFLAIMTSIGLTIAVLSIINTMLMSVTERIIEFGILKANGWSGRDVMKLITLESATLGFCGGCLGSGFGWLLTVAVNWQWPDQVRLSASIELLTFSLFFATILGVFGGLYPAIWATRMMPIDAIRRG